MVEVVGHKLATHHPVIEPVSALRRERKFPPQRQAGKRRLITRERQIQRRAKAPIPVQELRYCLRTFEPQDWMVVCAVMREPVSTVNSPVLREFNRGLRYFLA